MAYLKKQHLAEMIAHAREEAPLEACGILAGKEDRVVRVYRARNADRSRVSYRLEPEEQYRIFIDIEEKGWDILGIYHSHPTSPAIPSGIDLKQAQYPEAVYFVVSLADPVKPQVRAFKIIEGESLRRRWRYSDKASKETTACGIDPELRKDSTGSPSLPPSDFRGTPVSLFSRLTLTLHALCDIVFVSPCREALS